MLSFLKKAANDVIRPLAPIEAGAEVRRRMDELAEVSVRFGCRRETFLAVARLAFDDATAKAGKVKL